MLIKIFGLGLKEYLKDKFNCFDAVIVILSLADIAINFSVLESGFSTGKGAISAFRAFRLVRVFKLAKSWGKF